MEKTEPTKSKTYEKDDAMNVAEFLSTIRGQYIVGQALGIAIDQLESISPEHMQEKSNISDMKFLAENLFTIGYASHLANKQLIKQRRKEQHD